MSKIKLFSLLLCTGGLGVLMHYFIFTDATNNIDHFGTESTVTKDHNYYFDLYNTSFTHNPLVEVEYPSWASPDTSESITDLQHRVDTLPFDQDRNRYGYVVYPKHGVTTPLSIPSATDKKVINAGKSFDHYPYLEDGALHYWGTDPRNGEGNMVIAAHSSFKKDDPGRYKTVFQTLPISQAGEQVFVYLKETDGSYTLYIYQIEESYETAKTDISVLAQGSGTRLTTYGCYDIGSNNKRRINKAVFTKSIPGITLDANISNSAGTIRQKTELAYKNTIQKPIFEKSEHNIAFESNNQARTGNGLTTNDSSSGIIPGKKADQDNTHSSYQASQTLELEMILKISSLSDMISDRLQIEPEKYELVKGRVLKQIEASSGPTDTSTMKRHAIYSLIYHLVFEDE